MGQIMIVPKGMHSGHGGGTSMNEARHLKLGNRLFCDAHNRGHCTPVAQPLPEPSMDSNSLGSDTMPDKGRSHGTRGRGHQKTMENVDKIGTTKDRKGRIRPDDTDKKQDKRHRTQAKRHVLSNHIIVFHIRSCTRLNMDAHLQS